jgi:Cd2+/Zn2+-exporting ATPase
MENTTENNHKHRLIFGVKTELYFALICGVFLLTGFVIEKWINLADWVSLVSYIAAYVFGAYFISIEAFKKIIKGGFDIDFLMIAAAAGAAYIGSWAEGALYYSFLV